MEDGGSRMGGSPRPLGDPDQGLGETGTSFNKPKTEILRRVLFHGKHEEIPMALLEAAFKEIDFDSSGVIDLVEFGDALEACGLKASQNALNSVMTEIDKNADGTIDVHEFVEFFRHIEELNRYEAKREARKGFASCLLNCCFIVYMVVSGVLLMIFIKMDGGDASSKNMVQTLLMVCGIVLGVLFLLVILAPLLRLTCGPRIGQMREAMQELEARRRFKPPPLPQDEDAGPRAGGCVGADGMPTEPVVNAAMFGQSYRISKAVQGVAATCMFCGHMLPWSGQFCSTCGAMKPVVTPQAQDWQNNQMANSMASQSMGTRMQTIQNAECAPPGTVPRH